MLAINSTKFVLSFVVAVLGFCTGLALPDPNRMLTDPFNCDGWPEQRVYAEAQWWFTNLGSDIDSQSKHLHLGACVPFGRSINGNFTVHILAQLHLVDDRYLDTVSIMAWVPDLQKTITIGRDMTRWQCYGINNCKKVYSITADTSYIGYNGRMSFTIIGVLQLIPKLGRHLLSRELSQDDLPETQDLIASDDDVETTAAPPADSLPQLQHWLELRFSMSAYNGPNLPMVKDFWAGLSACAFASAPWTYTCSFYNFLDEAVWQGVFQTPYIGTEMSKSTKPGVIANITRSFISFDPSFHATPPIKGTVFLDQAGPYDNTTFIDTTKLSDGIHKLFIRADSFVDANVSPKFPQGGTNSGVLMLAFKVANQPATSTNSSST